MLFFRISIVCHNYKTITVRKSVLHELSKYVSSSQLLKSWHLGIEIMKKEKNKQTCMLLAYKSLSL